MTPRPRGLPAAEDKAREGNPRRPHRPYPVEAKPGKRGFGPMEAHPESVQDVLLLARRAGIIRDSWVADGHASPSLGSAFDESADDEAESVARYVRSAAEHLTLDPQTGRPVYIEVLCEAADLGPRLDRVADEYGVPVAASTA